MRQAKYHNQQRNEGEKPDYRLSDALVPHSQKDQDSHDQRIGDGLHKREYSLASETRP